MMRHAVAIVLAWTVVSLVVGALWAVVMTHRPQAEEEDVMRVSTWPVVWHWCATRRADLRLTLPSPARDGQRVWCPYCGQVFVYTAERTEPMRGTA